MKINKAIQEAIDACETQAELSRLSGISQSLISKMLNEEMDCSAKSAIAIEQATGGNVSRAQLCPELFNQRTARKKRA